MYQKISVLIIEDEKSICDFIGKTLDSHEYKVTAANNGKDGLALITSSLPDLVLLDLGLPDMDGMDIIRKTREWSSLPIIVISARTQEKEKVQALDAGADDYITKPFGTFELLARIRTAIRHNNKLSDDSQNANRPYAADGLTIDFERRLVTLHGKEIHLTRVEYKIVSLLAKNSGKVMTYDTLIDQVWGPYADDNNRILRVNMANIRRKIEENPGEPKYIFLQSWVLATGCLRMATKVPKRAPHARKTKLLFAAGCAMINHITSGFFHAGKETNSYERPKKGKNPNSL